MSCIHLSELVVESALSDRPDEPHGEYGAELSFGFSRAIACPTERRLDLLDGASKGTVRDWSVPLDLRADIRRALAETGGYQCPPMASMVIEMRARRCRSDSGESVQKTVGYAYPPVFLWQLVPGAVIERRLVDLSGVNECEIGDRGRHTGELRREFLERFTKGTIRMTIGKTDLPDGLKVAVDRSWMFKQVIERTTGTVGRMVENKEDSSVPVRYGSAVRLYSDVAGGGSSSSSSSSRRGSSPAVPISIAEYYERMYTVYADAGTPGAWESLMPKARRYVVPHYITSNGTYVPSSFDLCGSVNDLSPDEALLLQQLRIPMDDHQFGESDFVVECKKLARAGAWRTGPGARRQKYLEPRTIEALQVICEGLFTNITTSMAYTSDETRDRSRKSVPIDRLCTDICDLMGCDCEDGSCAHVRAYFAVVRNKHTWHSPVLQAVAHVLDLYRVVCTKMFCCGDDRQDEVDDGICHVHSSLVHADYLCAALMDGVRDNVLTNPVMAKEARRIRAAVADICYWPQWVYTKPGGTRSPCEATSPNSSLEEVRRHYAQVTTRWLPRMSDLVDDGPEPGRTGGEFVRCGIPATLYLEPTATMSPFQMPLDLLFDPADGMSASHIKGRMGELHWANLLKNSLASVAATRHLANEWSHNGNWCDKTAAEAFADERTETSRFYRMHESVALLDAAAIMAYRDDSIESNVRGAAIGLIGSTTARVSEVFSSGMRFVDAITNMSNHPRQFGVRHKHYASGSAFLRLIPNAFVKCSEFMAVQYAMQMERGTASLVATSETHHEMKSIAKSRALEPLYDRVPRIPNVLCLEFRPHLRFLVPEALERMVQAYPDDIVAIRVACSRIGKLRTPLEQTRRLTAEEFTRAFHATGMDAKDAAEIVAYADKNRALAASAILGEKQKAFVHDLYDFILRCNNLSVARVFVYVKVPM